jgi:signal peptidase I
MKSFWNLKDLTKQLLWIVAILAARSSLAGVYVVPTGSMEPTILPGDHLWVNHAAYDLKIPFSSESLVRISEPKRGEVIVFRDPKRPEINLVKRLVGLPGDHIKIRDGWIEINGKWIEHKTLEAMHSRRGRAYARIENESLGERAHQVQRLRESLDLTDGDQEFLVPAHSYFFMGDNRDNSHDSRHWGFVDRSQLLGSVSKILYRFTWQNPISDLDLMRWTQEV